AELGPQEGAVAGPVPVGEALQHGGGGGRPVQVVVDQRQQGLGEAGQVPRRDGRLVPVGVAAAVVDGAEHGGRVVGLHERAGAVVDRLAGDRGVVGVHHA